MATAFRELASYRDISESSLRGGVILKENSVSIVCNDDESVFHRSMGAI